ncbi:DUF6318 family protein [Cellulomonas sp.]|uniref:DUF6318 family protein n=1 Tax=Cellulomonas sp. TaxID=40001 RepID=UPI001B0AF5E0|nr:DUF6318 family protein [Cellulomonas sp.]MBO9555756.1 hypothetical protein [Cellulomonas sp.]
MRIRGTARRAIVVSAATALGAGLIAGCTSDPPTTSEPTFSGTRATSTPSPSVSPTANVRVKPERPDAWDNVSVDGAIAVATYFMELYGYTYATGDLESWNGLSHPDCEFCASTRDGVNDLLSAGQLRDGGAVTIADPSAREISPGELFSVDVAMTEAPARVVSVSGKALTDWAPGSRYQTNVLVLRDANRWWIRGVDASPVAGS